MEDLKKSEMSQPQLPEVLESKEVAVIPESRKKLLARIEKKHGIEAAQNRAIALANYRPMTNAVADQYVRRGENKGPKGKCIRLNIQINNAIGIKSVKDATPGQMGLIGFMRELFTKFVTSTEGGKEEKDLRDGAENAVRQMIQSVMVTK